MLRTKLEATTKSRIRKVSALAAVVMGIAVNAVAAEIPLELPRPDDKPGGATQSVNACILAGQSNRVGMEELKIPPLER